MLRDEVPVVGLVRRRLAADPCRPSRRRAERDGHHPLRRAGLGGRGMRRRLLELVAAGVLAWLGLLAVAFVISPTAMAADVEFRGGTASATFGEGFDFAVTLETAVELERGRAAAAAPGHARPASRRSGHAEGHGHVQPPRALGPRPRRPPRAEHAGHSDLAIDAAERRDRGERTGDSDPGGHPVRPPNAVRRHRAGPLVRGVARGSAGGRSRSARRPSPRRPTCSA